MRTDYQQSRIPLLLLPEELRQLTEFARRREQRERLAEMGIPFEVGRNGRPLVLREVVQARLGATTTKIALSTKPDVEALRELQSG
ncbi:MAG: DUF4224 domain-containing protein [Nitrospinae bacterium]|nr:DUF4224 domain-containing protein [Nitrospinota bacterium]